MKIGDSLPSFQAIDQDLNNVDSSMLKGKPLIIFFYPKDHSPGCTREVCAFRDHYEQFLEAGAQVIGVSSDSAESHRKFQENHRLPFPLISDERGQLRQLFGVSRDLFGLVPGRETFVFDAEGKLLHRFNSLLKFQEHARDALATLKG